jgi:hypothetical protein
MLQTQVYTSDLPVHSLGTLEVPQHMCPVRIGFCGEVVLLLGRLQWAAVVDSGRVARFPFMFREFLFIHIFQEVHVIIVVLTTCVTPEDWCDPAYKTINARVASIRSPHPVLMRQEGQPHRQQHMPCYTTHDVIQVNIWLIEGGI